MHTLLGRGQVIDSVPAHLQRKERYHNHRHEPSSAPPHMDRQQIQRPRCRRPRLLCVPTPIGSPRLLCPKCSCEHSDRKEGHTAIHQSIDGLGQIAVLAEQPIDRHQRRTPQQRVREHIDRHVGYEPPTLQCRHQRLVVNLGLEDI